MHATFLPDGRHVVSVGGPGGGGKQGEVRMWDVETGDEVRQFKGHGHEVKSVAVTPDGKRMITTGQDNCTLFWNVESGEEIRPLRMQGAAASGLCVSIARDGGLAALSCRNGSILVFEVETGKEICRLGGHKGGTGSVAITPDGRRVLSSGADRAIRMWEVQTGAEICRMEDFREMTGVRALSANGEEALVSAFDNTLRLVRLPPMPPVP